MERAQQHNFPNIPQQAVSAVAFSSDQTNSGAAVSKHIPSGRPPKTKSVSASSGGNPHRPVMSDFSLTSKETFGENLPGLLIEAIVDPDCPSQLALCCFDSKHADSPNRTTRRMHLRAACQRDGPG